ncbi:hypothetical protein [Pontibacter sp. G13]|uniref:hypothetical protein n=1 Tax=Pontibacter sp. G13 TaxID=3074898 RepID=UPI002889F8A6|nr:hypothetical protein [Pontibacter sp. G13]WNJ16317.1 hypothetical protein RJD25_15745 [Pontibacter sp. G13]
MEPQKLYIHARCPQCGSQLKFAGGKRKLQCTKCKYSRDLGRVGDQVQAKSLKAGVSVKHFERGLGPGFKSYQCGGCKSVIAIHHPTPETPPPTHCPFCEGTSLEETDRHEQVLQPYSLVPFMLSQATAASILTKWLKAGPPMLPNEILEITGKERLRPVFMPFFMFDSLARTTWKGEMAIKYLQKKGKGVEEKKAWEPTKGFLEHFFDDSFVLATAGGGGEFRSVSSYHFRKLVPFDPGYLGDGFVECYQKDELKGFEEAEKFMNGQIEGAVRRSIKSRELKDLKVTNEYTSISFRHVLVPVWVASYTYRGHRFQYFVNGQNGKVSGAKPISFPKIFAVVGTITVLTLGLVWLLS